MPFDASSATLVDDETKSSFDPASAVPVDSGHRYPSGAIGRGEFAADAGAESAPLVSTYSPAEKAGMEKDIKFLESPLVSPELAQAALRGSAAAMTGGLSEAAPKLADLLFPKNPVTPVLRGAEEGAGDILSSLTTPTNLALLAAGGPAARLGKLGTVLLSSAFEAQALQHAPEQWQQFKDAIDAGDYEKATRLGTGMIAGIGLPAAAVAIHGFQAPTPTLAETLFPSEAVSTTTAPVIPEIKPEGGPGPEVQAVAELTAPETAASPKLLPGETQGDLISSTQPEDLKLVGEQGTDFSAQQTEADAAAQRAEEARLLQENQQGLLADFQEHQAAGGDELLSALRDAGGLPAVYAADHPLSGELNALREEFEKSSKYTQQKFAKAGQVNFGDVFSAKGRQDIDQLTQDLRAKGFDVQTPSDLISLVQDRLRSGKPVYGNEARGAALEEASMAGFGPGAALAQEIPQAKEVSIRNGRVDQERTSRGELPLMAPARKAMGKTWDEAMRRIEENPNLGSDMTNQILSGAKKEVSETDHAVLLHEKIRVINERSMEADRASDSHASEEDRIDAHAKWAALEDRINNIDHATQQAGTISGRALQFRNAIARDDYTFAGMERRARAAKGRPLTEEESSEIKSKADQIQKAEQANAERVSKLDEQRSESSAESALSDFKKRAPKETKPIDRSKLLSQIRSAINEGAEPKDLSSYIQRIALFFVRDGITKRDPLVSAVHDFTKDATGFDIRQTRDAVSGYGDFRPLDKETAKVQLRQIKGEAQQISKLEDMAKGGAPLKTGLERRTPSDEERALIKQVNEAKKAGGFNVTDPATQLKSALEAVKTRLGNQIKDLQRQIDTGVRDIKERRATPTDAEAEALKAKRDELKKQFNDIFGSEISDAQRLARAKSYLTRRATELEERIKNNDFAPRPKPEPVRLDTEGAALKSKVEQLKLDFDRKLKQFQLDSRPLWQKAIDQVAGTARFAALSGYHTLQKLLGYTVGRGIEFPLTEAAGAIIDRIPGLKRIAEQANFEAGDHAKAVATYYKQFFTSGMREAAQVLKRYGQGDIKSAFGRRDVRPARWFDFFGVLHQAEKSPTLVASMASHYEKAVARSIANGVDVNDPLVQGALHKEAFDYAQRSILQEKNRFSEWVNDFNRRMTEVDKKTGEASATRTAIAKGVETLFTKGIIKTPANYVVQSLERTPAGLVTAAAKSAKVWAKGVDSLKPAEANTIARLWKVGLVGTGFFVWGMLDALKDEKDRVFGGYYQPGQKREGADAKWGSLRLGNFQTHILTHFPLLESAQIGSTLMRVARSSLSKKDSENRGVLAGIIGALFGLAERAPIASTAIRVGKAAGGPHDQDRFVSDVLRSLIPQMVQNLAEDLDKGPSGEPIKRKPEGLIQSLELGIPGLRKNVPTADETRRRNYLRTAVRR